MEFQIIVRTGNKGRSTLKEVKRTKAKTVSIAKGLAKKINGVITYGRGLEDGTEVIVVM